MIVPIIPDDPTIGKEDRVKRQKSIPLETDRRTPNQQVINRDGACIVQMVVYMTTLYTSSTSILDIPLTIFDDY